MLELLQKNPTLFFQLAMYRVPALIISLSCHEWAHAWVANRCGDPTARLMGRMTFNPLRHLDVLGTLMMLTVGFGWAKPVPVNPRNYRNGRSDDLKVSVAGVTVNLILFLLATALSVALNGFLWNADAIEYLGSRTFLDLFGYNYALIQGANNFSPLIRNFSLAPVLAFLSLFAQMNLSLAIFNLFPIPPLDGYHVFDDLLFKGGLRLPPQFMQGGMAILLLLSYTTDIVSDVIYFFASNIQGGVLTLFLAMTGGA